MCGLETSTSRSSDGMQYLGTWVIRTMSQSRLSLAKEQSNFGYRNAESFVRSEHAVRLIACLRHLNGGLRCFEMSECPETHDPTSRTPAPCATAVPGVGTFSNIDRERPVSETHKSGGTFRRRWQGQRAPVAQFGRSSRDIHALRGCTARVRLNYRVP